MTEQGWQTVTNKKQKNVKEPEPVKFDPIIARHQEAQAKINEEKQAKNTIKYLPQTNPNQDWNHITISKPQQKQKISLPQKEASAIKTNESGDIVQVKKVSPQMGKAICDARISKKWTQIQLAHNSTIDVKTIGEIEKGGGLYNANVFNKLCKTLGVIIDRNFIVEKKN